MMRTPRFPPCPRSLITPGKTHKRFMRHAVVEKSPSEPESAPGLNGRTE